MHPNWAVLNGGGEAGAIRRRGDGLPAGAGRAGRRSVLAVSMQLEGGLKNRRDAMDAEKRAREMTLKVITIQ